MSSPDKDLEDGWLWHLIIFLAGVASGVILHALIISLW